MKRMGFLVCAAVLAAMPSLAARDAAAQAAPDPAVTTAESVSRPELSWGATVASWYSFQGIDYSARRPVWQPEASVSVAWLSVSGWGNVDQASGVLNEVDVSVLAEIERGVLSASTGYMHLRYPHREGWLPSHELVADVGLATPFAPTLSLHWDVGEGRGRYATLGIGHEFPLGAATGGIVAKLHAQDRYYGMSGIPAAEAGASLTFVRGPLSVRPALARVWAWENGSFRDEAAIASGWVASLTVASP